MKLQSDILDQPLNIKAYIHRHFLTKGVKTRISNDAKIPLTSWIFLLPVYSPSFNMFNCASSNEKLPSRSLLNDETGDKFFSVNGERVLPVSRGHIWRCEVLMIVFSTHQCLLANEKYVWYISLSSVIRITIASLRYIWTVRARTSGAINRTEPTYYSPSCCRAFFFLDFRVIFSARHSLSC